MLGQRMAGKIEAQDLFLFGKPFGGRPFGQIGEIGRGGRGGFVLVAAEESHLAAAAVGRGRGAGLEGAVERGQQLRAAAAQGIQRARLDQRFDGRRG